MTGYELSRKWFDFCFENQEKIKPNHTALYFFITEHYNRMGQTEKFGLPTTMAKDAIGIKSYNTYINTLNDLIQWGFIKLIQKSENQYSSNIVALSNFNKPLNKSLDKALINHLTNQREITNETISSIIKPIEPLTINHKTIKEVCDFFGFSEINHFHNYKMAVGFIECLEYTGLLSHFENQFSSYKKIKSKGYKHSFDNFIGTPENLYEDGAWNKENWPDKLNGGTTPEKLDPENVW